ncbi:uncharacterized protein LOC117306712 isoform X2 [Asterias rubens]|uniref:uncharacterized protein LOC117306712 isoform X2 n=1 Tax=Asterias rubens TaxID=7604 RepID=UPI0014551D71|nr:uncharacterized protein LOC117306712 isoform X2 [Asterias rubens]
MHIFRGDLCDQTILTLPQMDLRGRSSLCMLSTLYAVNFVCLVPHLRWNDTRKTAYQSTSTSPTWMLSFNSELTYKVCCCSWPRSIKGHATEGTSSLHLKHVLTSYSQLSCDD